MSNIPEGLIDATRGQAFSLYRSIKGMTADLDSEQQRALLSEALEEVVACIEEMETADDELVRVNEALTSSRRGVEEKSRRYEDLFQSAPCGYLLTSPSGVIREANQAAGELLGVRSAEMAGKPMLVFLAEPERRELHGKLCRVAQDGGARDLAMTLQPRRGTPVSVRVNFGVLFDEKGKVVELRWLIQNPAPPEAPIAEPPPSVPLTEQASALEAANRRVEELEQENLRLTQRLQEHGRTTDGLVERLHGMENRLAEKTAKVRESFRSQNSTAQYVAKSCAEPLRIAGQQANSLASQLEGRLTETEHDRLVALAKRLEGIEARVAAVATLAETHDRPIKRDTVDTAMLVAREVDKLVRQFPNRSLEIRVGELPECEADPELLARVFSHLLSNALKFTRCRDNTIIEIGCRMERKGRVWFVRDNGIGYRKDQEHRLFLPFQTLHRAQGYAGAGVGLALVKQIVTRHGGRVWAEGREGSGATFYFTLA